MSTPTPELDADLLYTLDNDEETGALLVNAVEADEFDPRHSNDVEGLLFLGKLTHNAEIFGHSFILKTLTRGERLATSLIVKEYEGTLGEADALQTATVAASILTVDGRPPSFALTPEENSPLARIRANFAVVTTYYDPIIETLWAEYGNLLIRQVAAFQAMQGKSTASRRTF